MAAVSSLAVGACSDSTEPGGAIDRVEIVQYPISQAKTNMLRGVTLQLIAVPINEGGNFVDLPITWTSSDQTKATVDANGKVTTVAGGDVTISAAAGGKTGTYDINIQFPVGSITVTPANPTIRREGAVTLTATPIGTDNVAATGRTVTWSSANTAIATVNATTGVVSGVSDGTVAIIATSEGVTGQTNVTVSGAPVIATVTVTSPTGQVPFTAVGSTIQLTRTARAGSGTTVAPASTNWTTSSAATATVDGAGLVTCVAAGNATITATVPTGEGTNTVNGTLAVTCATPLAFGVATAVPSTAQAAIATYAVVVPTGTTTLTINTTAGSGGDFDMYAFSPSQTPGTLNTSGTVFPNYPSSSYTAVSGNSGNTESLTIAAPAAGTWRFILFNFNCCGTATGVTITANKVP